MSLRAAELIADPANEILVSAASVWEIAIKAQLFRIVFETDMMELLPRQIADNGITELPISSRHALAVHGLPNLHRDPFDRMLIAQAQVERIPLITADRSIAQYPVDVIW
jgi:PIN domain nuclease of toxin-antitoxin system